jgi:hypothetical protein
MQTTNQDQCGLNDSIVKQLSQQSKTRGDSNFREILEYLRKVTLADILVVLQWI